ncbi:exported hypothetical protein [Nostocoides australiense Ben110]|uniref:Uncharacterized protein n=1 Tax=Nostocoides australiense Ben110 TaxID=1193182 RepID=W6K3C3_9MICO|nr:exported hypothetical protein [Tetrasphaera australiensis Ben110]
MRGPAALRGPSGAATLLRGLLLFGEYAVSHGYAASSVSAWEATISA